MQTVTAGGLLADVNDPTSNFSQLVAAGDYQAALGYTYAKISLINLPPNLVGLHHYFSFSVVLQIVLRDTLRQIETRIFTDKAIIIKTGQSYVYVASRIIFMSTT